MSRWTTTKILRAVPPRGECVTVAELTALAGVDRKQVHRSCHLLLRRGLLKRVRQGCYLLTPAGRLARDTGADVKPGPSDTRPPRVLRKRGFRDRLWQALRQSGKVTLSDLLMLCSSGDGEPEPTNARQYLRALHSAGYLAVLSRRAPGLDPRSPGYLQYLLLKDTGPKTPVHRRNLNCVYDPNTGESHALTGAS